MWKIYYKMLIPLNLTSFKYIFNILFEFFFNQKLFSFHLSFKISLHFRFKSNWADTLFHAFRGKRDSKPHQHIISKFVMNIKVLKNVLELFIISIQTHSNTIFKCFFSDSEHSITILNDNFYGYVHMFAFKYLHPKCYHNGSLASISFYLTF